MQAQPVAQTIRTPATLTLPVNPVPQQQFTSPQQQLQLRQQPTSTILQSLGQNKVTLKGGKMIVSGPNLSQSQFIEKQLKSGARLAIVNGKQVLVSTTPTVINQQQKR